VRTGFLANSHRDDVAAARDALLGFLGASRARLVIANLEDMWGEMEPQNVPGTTGENPNWRRKARLSFEEMQSDRGVLAGLKALNDARGTASPARA
jgi:4-alpha-glucanotransferase